MVLGGGPAAKKGRRRHTPAGQAGHHPHRPKGPEAGRTEVASGASLEPAAKGAAWQCHLTAPAC